MNLHDQITDLGGEYHTEKVYFAETCRHRVVMRLPILEKPGVYIEVIHYSDSEAYLEEVLSHAFSEAIEVIDTYQLATLPAILEFQL